MARNPYWNTMWSDRDAEFYWSGVKFGAVYSAIMVPCVFIVARRLVKEFKEICEE